MAGSVCETHYRWDTWRKDELSYSQEKSYNTRSSERYRISLMGLPQKLLSYDEKIN